MATREEVRWTRAARSLIPRNGQDAVKIPRVLTNSILFVTRVKDGTGEAIGSIESGTVASFHSSNEVVYWESFYEVLETCGEDKVRWLPFSNRQLPQGAFQAGRDAQRRPLYIATCRYNGENVIGKLVPSQGYMLFAYQNTELQSNCCNVLCRL